MTPDAFIASDEATRVIFFNAAAEKLLGYEADEVIGTLVLRFVPEDLTCSACRHAGCPCHVPPRASVERQMLGLEPAIRHRVGHALGPGSR